MAHIMHCLYGLQQAALSFELKGGTSLSKGFGIIDRFTTSVLILNLCNRPNVRLHIDLGTFKRGAFQC